MYVPSILWLSFVLQTPLIRQEKRASSERTFSEAVLILISESKHVQVLSYAAKKPLLLHHLKVKEVCLDLNLLSLQQRVTDRSLPTLTM